jgi:hypothetical protein
MRRIGAFAGIEDDAEGQARFAAFVQGLRQIQSFQACQSRD